MRVRSSMEPELQGWTDTPVDARKRTAAHHSAVRCLIPWLHRKKVTLLKAWVPELEPELLLRYTRRCY